MIGPTPIDDLPGKVAALRSALQKAMPNRVHKDGYRRDIDEHLPDELRDGVVMLVAGTESDYSDRLGMEAREGDLRLALVIEFRIDADDDGAEVERQELAMAEEIKDFVRAGVPGIGLDLGSIYTSSQQITPYGFVVAELIAGPPRHTLN